MATAARVIFLAALLMPAAAAALDDPPCLSLNEVKGSGHPRYHIINGRQCWYSSTAGVQAKPAAKPDPEAESAEIEVNPYGDPIWQGDGKLAPTKPRAQKPAAMGGPLVISPGYSNPR
jgi:hypothetical protein